MSKPVAPRRVGETEAMARSTAIRVTPSKLNLVAQLIRGKSAEQALADLTFSTKRVAQDVKKTLQAAIANAENNHSLDVDRLFVSHATVGKAMLMKRWHARGRGRSSRIEKFFSNLTIIVKEREAVKKAEKETKKTEGKKAPAKKTTKSKKEAA